MNWIPTKKKWKFKSQPSVRENNQEFEKFEKTIKYNMRLVPQKKIYQVKLSTYLIGYLYLFSCFTISTGKIRNELYFSVILILIKTEVA